MFPRRLALFAQPAHAVAKIAAGATFSMAFTKHNMLYLWGQQGVSLELRREEKVGLALTHLTHFQVRGEANMYPKPIHDLAGYNIRTFAGG